MHAAQKLDATMPFTDAFGYPRYLPSFDEHVVDLEGWLWREQNNGAPLPRSARQTSRDAGQRRRRTFSWP